MNNKKLFKKTIFILCFIFLSILTINCVSAAADVNSSDENYLSTTTQSNAEGVIDASNYLIDTRITGLQDYTIDQKGKTQIKVNIEGYYEHWGGIAYRYVDFYLYDADGVQVWKDKSISSGIFNPGHVSITMNNQKLNLSPGTYLLMAKFEARSDYGPSEACANLTITSSYNTNNPKNGDTRINGLLDQTVVQGNYADIIVSLESLKNNNWNVLTLKHLYFSLYDDQGKLIWKDKLRTDNTNGTGIFTIYTSKLNLKNGIYRMVVEYDGSKKYNLSSSQASAYLTVILNISNSFFDDLASATRIHDFNDYSVVNGKKITVKAKLVREYFSWDRIEYGYEGLPWRYLNFDLHDLSGNLLWHSSELTNLFTYYASATIDTKKLNLSPGTYLLRVTYGGNYDDLLKPCEDTSFLYVT